MLKTANIVKFNQRVPKEFLVTTLSKNRNDTIVKYLMKGFRLMNFKLSFDWNADDFMKDLITAKAEWTAHKIPRFLRNHLLKSYKIKSA